MSNQPENHPDRSQTTAEKDFRSLVRAVRVWVDNHMDQWEKFKYEDQYGPLYVTISRTTDYPDSFDPLPVENQHGQ